MDLTEYLYFGMIGLGLFYLLTITLAKIINNNRGGARLPRIGSTSKKMTLSSVRSSQLLGRIAELEAQDDNESYKRMASNSSLVSSGLTPKGNSSEHWRFVSPDSPSYTSKPPPKPKRSKERKKSSEGNVVELRKITHISTDFTSPPQHKIASTDLTPNPDYQALHKMENLREKHKHKYTVLQFGNGVREVQSTPSMAVFNQQAFDGDVKTVKLDNTDSEIEIKEPVYAKVNKLRSAGFSLPPSLPPEPEAIVTIGDVRLASVEEETQDEVLKEPVYRKLSDCVSATDSVKSFGVPYSEAKDSKVDIDLNHQISCQNGRVEVHHISLTEHNPKPSKDVPNKQIIATQSKQTDQQADLSNQTDQLLPTNNHVSVGNVVVIEVNEPPEDMDPDENPYEGIWMTSPLDKNNNISDKESDVTVTCNDHGTASSVSKPDLTGDTEILDYSVPDQALMSSKVCDEMILKPSTIAAVLQENHHIQTMVLTASDSEDDRSTVHELDISDYHIPPAVHRSNSPRVGSREAPPTPPKPSQNGTAIREMNGARPSPLLSNHSPSSRPATPPKRQPSPRPSPTPSDRTLKKLKEKAIYERYLKFERPPIVTPDTDIIPKTKETFISTEINPAPGIFCMSENDFVDDIDKLMMNDKPTEGFADTHFCQLCADDVFHVHKKPKQKVLSVKTTITTKTRQTIAP